MRTAAFANRLTPTKIVKSINIKRRSSRATTKTARPTTSRQREKANRKNEKRLHGITVEPFSFISGSEDIAGRETRRQNFADTNYFYSYVQSCSQLRRLAPRGNCTDPQRFPARRDVASRRQSCRPWRTRRTPRRPPETNRGISIPRNPPAKVGPTGFEPATF